MPHILIIADPSRQGRQIAPHVSENAKCHPGCPILARFLRRMGFSRTTAITQRRSLRRQRSQHAETVARQTHRPRDFFRIQGVVAGAHRAGGVGSEAECGAGEEPVERSRLPPFAKCAKDGAPLIRVMPARSNPKGVGHPPEKPGASVVAMPAPRSRKARDLGHSVD